MSSQVLIIGAGPAGLTAAYELLRDGSGKYDVIILEESDSVGGIAKTVNYKGNRMDMGGHRFFSKVPEVNLWWEQMLPIQGKRSYDDRVLKRKAPVHAGGPDPEQTDRVMLRRRRISRILFNDKFYDYPISLKTETIRNLGMANALCAGFSYLVSVFHKLPEDNLENFYINRFGKKLYQMFFEHYTENLWGRHPREIDASWGSQRVKGLSVSTVLRDMIGKKLQKRGRQVETSLIEEFSYPKLGPGLLWEITAEEIKKLGGKILTNHSVIKILKDGNDNISGLTVKANGEEKTISGDIVISSMPLKDLVLGMNDVPKDIKDTAAGLPYRDYITVGVLTKKLALKNKTNIRTLGNIIPDCWVYIQNRNVRMGRFQIYNNWSPYMVADPCHTVWLGLEYFVQENDDLWNMTDTSFAKMAVSEMVKLGLVHSAEDILDTHVERVKKAYPAYFDTYHEIDRVIQYLNHIPNLYCVGRNGQHRYNNIDHSMCTSFEAVKNIREGVTSKDNIWNINTEKDYHEAISKSSK